MKRNLLILLTALLFSCSLTSCGSETVVAVNIKNEENINCCTVFGMDALIYIGNGLYYDSTTRIVYFKYYSNGLTISPYYAPNGFPYKYNPETNTFEEIEVK